MRPGPAIQGIRLVLDLFPGASGTGFIEVLYDNGIRFPVQYDNMEFIDIIKLI